MKRKCYSISAAMLPWLILICGCLSACSGAFPWALASPTSTATSTVTPSITPSATPTLTFTPTPTPTPTNTPLPTATPTKEPTPTVTKELLIGPNGQEVQVFNSVNVMFLKMVPLTDEEIREALEVNKCYLSFGSTARTSDSSIVGQYMTFCAVGEPVVAKMYGGAQMVFVKAIFGNGSANPQQAWLGVGELGWLVYTEHNNGPTGTQKISFENMVLWNALKGSATGLFYIYRSDDSTAKSSCLAT